MLNIALVCKYVAPGDMELSLHLNRIS